MNLYQIQQGAPVPRVALTLPNVANAVERQLGKIGVLPVLSGLPGVYITGSNVWRVANGLPVADDADVDIMCVDHKTATVDESRDEVVERLHLADSSYTTAPSMTDDRDSAIMPGRKYVAPNGRVVDIWGMEDVHKALQQYPAHSHASSRMAWDCEHGCLIVFANDNVDLQAEALPMTAPPDPVALSAFLFDGD